MATKMAKNPLGDVHAVEDEPPLLEDLKPDWPKYRRRSLCSIWEAVMLSLDIWPSRKNRRRIRDSALAEEFKLRLDHLNARYGEYKPISEFYSDFGEPANKSDRTLDLDRLLEFAKRTNWAGLANLEAGLLDVDSAAKSRTGASSEAHARAVRVELPKGERYSLMQLGSLLQLLEDWATNDPQRNLQDLLKPDGKLSVLGLAREVESAVARASEKKQGGEKVVGTDLETLRKQFSKARKVFAMQTS